MNPNHDTLPTAVCEAVAQLRAESPVSASDALLTRIQRSRAKGARVFLPLSDAPVVEDAPSLRWWRGGMVAAGLAAMVIIAVARPRPSALTTHGASAAAGSPNAAPTESASTGDASGNATSPASPLAELLSPWPRVAYAQPAKGGRPGAYAALSGLESARVRHGKRSYVRLSASAYHDLLPHEFYELDVDTTHLGGTPAWRLVTRVRARQSLAVTLPEWWHDTLWLDRRTLRPLQRRYENGVLRMSQRFTDSSLVELDSMIVPSKDKRPFRFGVTKALDPSRIFVASEAMLRVLLQASPLSATWRASVGVLDGNSRMFAQGVSSFRNLRVAGVDTVQTFGGRYVAWRVEMDTGDEPERWYVSQESGEVLLVRGQYDRFSYPRSESHMIGGFSEKRRLVPVKSRVRTGGADR
jgi:hypothetical protein